VTAQTHVVRNQPIKKITLRIVIYNINRTHLQTPNNQNLDVTVKVVRHIGAQEQTRPQTTTRGAGSTHRRGPVLARAHVPRGAAVPSGAAGQGLAPKPPRPPACRQRWVTW
jgi:hypothetical protein